MSSKTHLKKTEQEQAHDIVHEALKKGLPKWEMEYKSVKAKYDQLGIVCETHQPPISPLELDFGNDFDSWVYGLPGKDKAIAIKHKLDEYEKRMHQFRQDHRLHDAY